MKQIEQANLQNFYTHIDKSGIQSKGRIKNIKNNFAFPRPTYVKEKEKKSIRRSNKRWQKKSTFLLKKKFLRSAALSNKNRRKKKNISTIHIQSTYNNTIYTLSRGVGETNFSLSAGMCGFKNARKSTSYASQTTAEKLAGLIKKKFLRKNFYVKIRGLGAGKLKGLRALHHSGIRIKNIQDCAGLAHNGCRATKRRRL